MVVVELCRVKFSTSKRSPSGRASAGFKCGSLQLSAIVADLWHVVVIFLFGAGCSQVATDIGKYSIGRLRYIRVIGSYINIYRLIDFFLKLIKTPLSGYM